VLQFILVFGGSHGQTRDAAQIREIQSALVCPAIITHDTGPVNGEDHGQILDTDIVDYLIIGSLQEG